MSCSKRWWVALEAVVLVMLVPMPGAGDATAPPRRQLLWGDTHLHTSNSFDAYLNRNMSSDPDTAFRFAKGLPVVHPFHRARVQIDTPLDFLVVSDHAEYLGVIRHIVDRGIPRDDLGFFDRIRAWYAERWLRGVVENDEGMSAFRSFLPKPSSVEEAAKHPPKQKIPAAAVMSKTLWQEAVATADAHNEPGKFTALIGWEWSSTPAGANLHRVVFTNADAQTAGTIRPWSAADSMYPQDLWRWLDDTSRRTGADFVAIPHNSNLSKGYMFGETLLGGQDYTAEMAKIRARWEPVAEVTQIKGDSETHPELSPDDPFADFETYGYYIQNDASSYEVQPGDYARSALLRGLAIEEKIGFNPYQFGMIGSTDAHTGLSSAEEPNFWGKLARDSIPENKRKSFRGKGGQNGWSMSASGLAAVWAEENTRDAILDAFRRREVYATTGPRIEVRAFAGWDFSQADLHAASIADAGYTRGVPMGSRLERGPQGAAPTLLVHAVMDPRGAHLDRIQVIKGWIDAAGQTQERVYDVAWSGDRKPDAAGQIGPVGDTVDVETATYENSIGAPELAAVWRDPDFDPNLSSFYYTRTLEIPTPRHSLYDAIALGLDAAATGHPAAIQERAYTSPIWYRPRADS